MLRNSQLNGGAGRARGQGSLRLGRWPPGGGRRCAREPTGRPTPRSRH